MIFQPKAIFFDWDHTLWDHDRNSKEVILELVQEFGLDKQSPFSMEAIWNSYQRINTGLWDDYQLGKISQSELRESRFIRFFEAIQVHGPAHEFSNFFLYRTPRKKHLMEGAQELIETIAPYYPLYILTNGFEDIQFIKVESSGIGHHFKELITSQVVGAKKPETAFFEYALKRANCAAEEALMVGDNWHADIYGANQAGIPAIHYNLFESSEAVWQISDLKHVKNHLKIYSNRDN
ncbi:YjjG family noncanonical pyrimidine nucleotidase [Aquirufa rosea]|uniref:Noncanonical pyrimidine nucleotidase, YjjG family n=1 Tax=Aquirufa rosea TaxID=2509241 RepID=A0A4Q1BYF3_9BACT|nr:YjjG family noncanonical pyrimidine nucleotidase [Aquirufa rosea]RXK48127.1 noncanonical pyrimidine nucleotidase, YjjG family [Aquirufa rosea]